MRPTGVTAEDFRLELTDEWTFSDTLLHLFSVDFSVSVAAVDIIDPEAPFVLPDLESARDRLQLRCSKIPGFATIDRTVIANFSYGRLPMVRDLEVAHDAIAAHVLLSAIAGDEAARHELRSRIADQHLEALVPVPPPEDEFLILDADSSQSWVVGAAVSGADLVVVGPPGTGKSQTISNLIATFVARGKSVLFVAEKRAAISAVTRRLEAKGLQDVVIDMHDRGTTRKRVAEQLATAISTSGSTLPPELSDINRTLDLRRASLDRHASQLHQQVEPWRVSAFEAQTLLLAIPNEFSTEHRFRGARLEKLDSPATREVDETLRQFVGSGVSPYELVRTIGPRHILVSDYWT